MEIYFSEHNGKMVAVLLDDEMKIVRAGCFLRAPKAR